MQGSSDPFYLSERWRKKREHILRRDGYQDQVAKNFRGVICEADIVHHILPREDFPCYEWCDWNLISVSTRTHRELHQQFTGGLTKLGRVLMNQAALEHGIKLNGKILVIGLPGSGKTTYVQRHLEGGIAYDLDYLAAAFRLTAAHSEDHAAAIRLSNDLLTAFADRAQDYCSKVYIIRTAPTTDELAQIAPDKLIVCHGSYDISNRKDKKFVGVGRMSDLTARIAAAVVWAKANGIEVETLPPS